MLLFKSKQAASMPLLSCLRHHASTLTALVVPYEPLHRWHWPSNRKTVCSKALSETQTDSTTAPSWAQAKVSTTSGTAHPVQQHSLQLTLIRALHCLRANMTLNATCHYPSCHMCSKDFLATSKRLTPMLSEAQHTDTSYIIIL